MSETTLFEALKTKIETWRSEGYLCEQYPLLTEILNYQKDEQGRLTFLRQAQFEAIETYFYLRCVLNTPKVLAIYKHCFPKAREQRKVLGIPTNHAGILDLIDEGIDIFQHIASNEEFAKELKLNTLYESLTLDYPSYILALVMGAGKTLLIGAIIGIEFALSLEYPEADFMKNALVFAPGTTILESLKEIAQTPYDILLPRYLYNKLGANIKYVFTGEKTDLHVMRGSNYNIVVTNSEKIRPQNKVQKTDITPLFSSSTSEAKRELTFNHRIDALCHLPSLGIFSDEAHHTYGNNPLELKKIRQAVDYLAEKTQVVCVVNTTGTPYDGKKPLLDVVCWYGLTQAIEDGVLKSVHNNIISYDMKQANRPEIIEDVLKDFAKDYLAHSVEGCKAKIAFYFGTEASLQEAKAQLEKVVSQCGFDASEILTNTQKSSKLEVDAFNRLNQPTSPHRIILLVGKGTEGWNCPSLFATALIREIQGSNNLILQASTRCLRQVVGNSKSAKIYLHSTNASLLNKQLNSIYGISDGDLSRTEEKTTEIKLVIRKTKLPTFTIKRIVRSLRRVESEASTAWQFNLPEIDQTKTYKKRSNLNEKGLAQIGTAEEVQATVQLKHLVEVATDLASIYRLKATPLYQALLKVYPEKRVPSEHILALKEQLEQQLAPCEVIETEVEEALAILKFTDVQGNDVFPKDEATGEYYTTVRIGKSKERLLKHAPSEAKMPDYGYHYTPYNFDSEPERHLFEQLLLLANESPETVEDVYFTGAITHRTKTDLFFEYKDDIGKFHDYYPDFFVLKKDGTGVLLEVKAENERNNVLNGETGFKAQAMNRLMLENKDKFKYKMVFTPSALVSPAEILEIKPLLTPKTENAHA